MQQLIKNIEQWAEDRNLINGSTPQKQMLKLMEEFGELCAGVATNEFETILDSVGDCLVVCTIMRKQLKMEKLFSIDHCDNTNFNCGVAAQIVQANMKISLSLSLNSTKQTYKQLSSVLIIKSKTAREKCETGFGLRKKIYNASSNVSDINVGDILFTPPFSATKKGITPLFNITYYPILHYEFLAI